MVAFGAFVEILPGVEGLVHISELADHHVENPSEVVEPGTELKVKILEVDEERRRLSLSIKRVEGQDLPMRDIQPPEGGTPPAAGEDTPDLDLSEEVFAEPPPEVEAEAAAETPQEVEGESATEEPPESEDETAAEPEEDVGDGADSQDAEEAGEAQEGESAAERPDSPDDTEEAPGEES